MLDHMWERERERERNGFVREEERSRWSVMIPIFYFSFYRQDYRQTINIKICNISVGDSVCKVKWKFLTCTKTLKNPLQTLLMTFHFINDFVRKKSE
jgi:hypothetical protein